MARDDGPTLLTGAFGNLGQVCLEHLVVHGHDVVCTDAPTRANRRTARRLGWGGRTVWADVTDTEALARVVGESSGILHLAGVLPPGSEAEPGLARRVNVGATAGLVDLASRHSDPPVFVYPSSVTVFGHQQDRPGPRTADDPVEATDHYTSHKLACEAVLRGSPLPWVVARVGVSVDARTTRTDAGTMRRLLGVSPDNRLEWVHPRDVATALVNALRTPEAWRRVLLVGGGPACRVSHARFLQAAFGAAGIHLPPDLLGADAYYTDWMDTAESQRLLCYQHHTFEDYERELRARLRLLRPFLRPLSPLVVAGLRRWLRAGRTDP
ncbi:MAG: NAD-dependent epimerase/dehydratase family protein [Myxococcota bacterium]